MPKVIHILFVPEPYAKEMCGKLYGDMFRPCHDEIDPIPYHKNCLYDVCECEGDMERDCVCDALAVYARACSFKGITLKWRASGFCGENLNGYRIIAIDVGMYL